MDGNGAGNGWFIAAACINVVVVANAGGAFSPVSYITTLSSHVVVLVGEDRDAVLARLQQLLRDRCGSDHATLQIVEERRTGLGGIGIS